MRLKISEQIFFLVFGAGMWILLGLKSTFFETAILQLWGFIGLSAVLLVGSLVAGDLSTLFSPRSERGQLTLTLLCISTISAIGIFLSDKIEITYWWPGFIVFTLAVVLLYLWSINKKSV